MRKDVSCQDAHEEYKKGYDYIQKKDFDSAVKYFESAANKGHIDAQYFLGEIYSNGWGGYDDCTKALDYYLKAANQGHKGAQSEAAKLYLIYEEYKNCMDWGLKAAQAGIAEAQWIIGFLYQRGLGISKNTDKAIYWYEKSAYQNFNQAYLGLGYVYETDKGDFDKALYWYKMGAQNGFDECIMGLAIMYQQTNKNYDAVYWFNKVIKESNDNELRDEASRRLFQLTGKYSDGFKSWLPGV